MAQTAPAPKRIPSSQQIHTSSETSRTLQGPQPSIRILQQTRSWLQKIGPAHAVNRYNCVTTSLLPAVLMKSNIRPSKTKASEDLVHQTSSAPRRTCLSPLDQTVYHKQPEYLSGDAQQVYILTG
ncbi:hypothetical protein SCLCIDRAFT_1216428 [Scleroderma citrinum Foug A]|uniref:Uncharacterized protein n=1 Tax=Scleroderma citrinum Foug A TaxID=1036808 RepID=A0A0C2ZGY6_9AGAM|nr:hypothetical protein SCLCIDRAFT_1216428 [Scleroderma citrinum Foug A]